MKKQRLYWQCFQQQIRTLNLRNVRILWSDWPTLLMRILYFKVFFVFIINYRLRKGDLKFLSGLDKLYFIATFQRF